MIRPLVRLSEKGGRFECEIISLPAADLMTKLCKDCADALEYRLKTPMHLVHPENGKFMVFDIYGMAVCPACSAIWYRDPKSTVVLNERKPPKRAKPGPGTFFGAYFAFALEQRDSISERLNLRNADVT